MMKSKHLIVDQYMVTSLSIEKEMAHQYINKTHETLISDSDVYMAGKGGTTTSDPVPSKLSFNSQVAIRPIL